MLFQQMHRGPDGSGICQLKAPPDRTVTLGHRRLSILDLSEAGSQPMHDVTGRYSVTYNGEIYNYLELRAELKNSGLSFRSNSDTEVLLEAYKQWGVNCVDHFNGMFAFAIYDSTRQVLFCARDRYGEKPFLFSLGKDYFAFASEYKALLQHPGISLEHDEWRLIRAAYNPGTALDSDRQTVFRDIQQLLPGEAMEIDVHTLSHKVWRYWQINPSETVACDEREIFSQFRELLIDAVRLRMRSDVPVGSCLSGGLDSSAIVGIARHLLGADAKYHTFTGRFPGTPADEWEYAKVVVEQNHVESHVVEPSVDRFLDDLPVFIWHNELPVGSSSQYAQWCVFRLARENGVTVLLDGQGADEVLAGYEQYFARYVEDLRERGDTSRLHRELPQIRERYPLALASNTRALRDCLPFGLRHWLSNRLDTGTSMLYGLNSSAAQKVARQNTLPRLAGIGPLANALVQDSFGRSLTTLLRYGDRNSMAHSREVRLPFCDHRLAELVFRLPPHMLMGGAQTKRILRESMRGFLPEVVRTRWNKQGFRPPQDRWFKSARMLNTVRDTLASASFRSSPYWIPGWWDKSIKRIERGETALGWTVWHPFIIEQWRSGFVSVVRQQRDLAR